MKTFRVREVFKAKGWTYIKAESEEAAIKILEGGIEDDFREESFEHQDTDWKTLEEVQ